MRALILGNMANDGYAVAKELRRMGAEVDLAVNSSDFGMSFPEWEEGYFNSNADPYSLHRDQIKHVWDAPDWIKHFDLFNKIPRTRRWLSKMKSRAELMRLMREYDVVEAQVPYAIFSQFSGIPYLVYDAGWIRYFPYRRDLSSILARRGYEKARKILFTNSDTLKIFRGLTYLKQERLFFTPFAIDCEKYKPVNASNLRKAYVDRGELLLFCPARQLWREKGNDKLLYAFAKFAREFPTARLVAVSWSLDKERSRELANSLGVSDSVIWAGPMNKAKLIAHYNAADIVLDQFVLGGWGTSMPEAMSCGRPTITSWAGKDQQDRRYVIECFGGEPPIPSAYTVQEIHEAIAALAQDERKRRSVGDACRAWIMRTHSPRLVASRHLEAMREAS